MSEIYTKICPVCGIEFKTGRGYQKYCSKRCSNRGRKESVQDYDPTLEWTKTAEDGHWVRPYNNGVGCEVRKCSTCGWNPDVAKARTEAYERKRKGE